MSDPLRFLRAHASALPPGERRFAETLIVCMAGLLSADRVSVETLDQRLRSQIADEERAMEGVRAQLAALETSIGMLPRMSEQQTIHEMREHAVREYLAALESIGVAEHIRAVAALAYGQYLQTIEAIMLRSASSAVQLVASHYTKHAGNDQ